MNNLTASRILRTIMHTEGVPLKHLSERTSVHYNTMLNILNGVNDTRLNFLEDLCYELGYELTIIVRPIKENERS